MIKTIERGWAGHFICGNRCGFRRNTLIKKGEKRIIVSTVGALSLQDDNILETIGCGGRYYETMAFEAIKEGSYWESDTSRQINFDNNWAICAESADYLESDVDNKANDMHDAVVKEIIQKLK